MNQKIVAKRLPKANHHVSLRLQNFTAFEDATFNFCPGVNAFVGENGTGKTHVMKSLYAWQLHQARVSEARSSQQIQMFTSVFQADSEADLVRLGSDNPQALVSGQYGKKEWVADFLRENPKGSFARAEVLIGEPPRRPVFIPAIDMMGHTKGFVTTFDEYRIDFDQTHRDIVSLLLGAEKRKSSEMSDIFSDLAPKLGGNIVRDGERFFLETENGRQPMPTVAEGLRKIATLVQLVKNGWLEKGSTLFWDEPEVNVNPILMDELVGAILALSRRGVQVFLATHSYVVLKELDLQAAKDPGLVKYFAFGTEDGATIVRETDDFSQLTPNPILDQYSSLYDRELMRATGRSLSRDH